MTAPKMEVLWQNSVFFRFEDENSGYMQFTLNSAAAVCDSQRILFIGLYRIQVL